VRAISIGDASFTVSRATLRRRHAAAQPALRNAASESALDDLELRLSS